MSRKTGVGLGFGAVLGFMLVSRSIAAQQIQLTGPLAGAPSVTRSYTPSPGSKLTQGFLMPTGQIEAGGEMVFLTGEPAGRERALEFTDLGLLRLRARRALGEWGELFIGSQLLVKQPEDWDESIWQSALGGLLVPFGHRLATALYAGGGVLFGEDGWWWQVQPTLLAKPVVDKWVRFELGIGHSFMLLDIEGDDRRFFIEEIAAHAQAQLGRDTAGMWVGIDYSLPIASGPDEPDAHSDRFLDPQVQLGLQVGGVLSPQGENWDLFVIYSVVDRGDLESPGTTLPILDGGFDQRQLAIGVQHRFGAKKSRRDYDYAY